jgi:choline dehydrogenase-like flavoprotein
MQKSHPCNLSQPAPTVIQFTGRSLANPMIPSDFEMNKRYGVGENWPISYRDLEQYYVDAENDFESWAKTQDWNTLLQGA